MVSEMATFIISGAVLFVLPFFLVGGFWLRGFFVPYMRVRASQGARIFIFAWNVTRYEFPTGVLKEGMLIFSHNKTVHRINVTDEDFFRFMRVNAVMVDLKTAAVIRKTGVVVSGYDPVKTDSLITRALMKPTGNDLLVIVILVVVILVLLLLCANVFFGYQTLQLLKQGGSAAVKGVIGGV